MEERLPGRDVNLLDMCEETENYSCTCGTPEGELTCPHCNQWAAAANSPNSSSGRAERDPSGTSSASGSTSNTGGNTTLRMNHEQAGSHHRLSAAT